MKNFNPVRGTYDYLPREAKLRELTRQIILESYQSNGFNLIETPILEHIENLSNDSGDNQKLMFKTIKRRDKLDLSKADLTEADIVAEGLRYDLTVPLARFYANNRDKLPLPFKSIQIGSAFRAERPQRGRNRQFTQCDTDIFGDRTINAELDLLKTSIETLNKLGFVSLDVRINSREILNAVCLYAGFSEDEINSVCSTLDKIDKIAVTGVMMELIEKGFSVDKINKLIDTINEILESGLDSLTKYGVDKSIVDNMSYLINSLTSMVSEKCRVRFDISIVRGQGYYTGTVYEIYTEGFTGAIVGGGRYDKMVGKISGIDTYAVGCSIGFEPITMLLLERGKTFNSNPSLALIYDESDDIVKVFEAKDKLKEKYNVSLFLRPKNMKAFYEKITLVADFVTSVRDFYENKDIKRLAN